MDASKRSELRQRLDSLHLLRNQSRKLNHNEVVEEDKRSKLPANWDKRRRRLEWEEKDEEFKSDCVKKGLDPERTRLRTVPAYVADKLEARKAKKITKDEGFSSYSDASYRKYIKATRHLKPNLQAYQKEKERLGPLAFPSADTIGLTDRKDDPESVERLAKATIEQSIKRSSYSRRRPFDADADIDYINERNKRYNELLERHYGQYTAEIKQNLERGTAI